MTAERFKLQTAWLIVIVTSVLLIGLPSVVFPLNCECNSSTALLQDGQCYTLSPTKRPQSAETCQPGSNAIVDSRHKSDSLWESLLSLQTPTTFVWIGLVDAVPSGGIIGLPRNWTWESGQELTWAGWRVNEPNGFSNEVPSGIAEDCVIIDKIGQWQDKPCSTELFTLCETSKPAIQGSHWFRLLMTNKWLGLQKERLLVSSLKYCSLLCFSVAECYMFAVGTAADSVGLICQLGCYYDLPEDAPSNDWRLFYRDTE